MKMANTYVEERHLRILKSISAKVSETRTLILAYMYYSDRDNKDNNQYRYEGLVVDNREFEEKIKDLESRPNLPWRWGHLVPNDFAISYHNDTNRAAARFYRARMDKALPTWGEFLKKANENVVKRYPLTGYICEPDGAEIDIFDRDVVESLVGRGFSHVRDRAERTFEVLDKTRVFKKYKSGAKPEATRVVGNG